MSDKMVTVYPLSGSSRTETMTADEFNLFLRHFNNVTSSGLVRIKTSDGRTCQFVKANIAFVEYQDVNKGPAPLVMEKGDILATDSSGGPT